MKSYARFIPMVFTMGMIFYLSHQPGDYVQLPQFPAIDKLAHVVAYGCLAASILYGLNPGWRTRNQLAAAIIVVLSCLLFGIGDEYHQSFIPGRFAGFPDVAADAAGALLAVGWWYVRAARKS